jgi:DnaJ-class molecular chaperone
MDGSEQLTPAERNAMGVLELSWPTTRADVKSRYKELVKIHHPDANGGAREAEEKLKEINVAYSTLRASERLPVE